MPFFTSVLNQFPEHSLEVRTINKDRQRQCFIVHRKPQAPHWQEKSAHEIKNDEISRVIETPEGYIVKYIKQRTWHDNLRIFFGASKISAELRSCIFLQNIGLRVPTVLEYGMAFIPGHLWGVTGYYLMKKHPAVNIVKHHFRHCDQTARQRILTLLIRDLQRLRDARCVYRDLSFRNMMTNDNGELFWIDTNIRRYAKANQKFIADWNKTLKVLLQELSMMSEPAEHDGQRAIQALML